MNKKLNFETFKAERIRFGGEPKITIQKKGGFGFTSAFLKKYLPEQPVYVTLNRAQDNEQVYLGFKFSKDKSPGSLKIFYPKGNYGLVQAPSFFKRYSMIPADYSGEYDVNEYIDDNIGKLFIIKLNDKV